MKKKIRHHAKSHGPVTSKVMAKRGHGKNEQYLVLVRGWMFFVLIALMMGLGLVLGNYLNAKLNGTQVAGAQVELR